MKEFSVITLTFISLLTFLAKEDLDLWAKAYIVQTSSCPTKKEFRKAYKYHGICFSYYSEERKRWEFKREGKICPLFAYLKAKGGD